MSEIMRRRRYKYGGRWRSKKEGVWRKTAPWECIMEVTPLVIRCIDSEAPNTGLRGSGWCVEIDTTDGFGLFLEAGIPSIAVAKRRGKEKAIQILEHALSLLRTARRKGC